GERGSGLESLGLENDVFEDTALWMETICRTEASNRSPISNDETYGPCEETTDRPLELDQSPISGDEAGAHSVETTDHTEAIDQSSVSENNDNDSCMDEFDTIPSSALPVPNLLILLSRWKRSVALKQVTGRLYLMMKLVVPVKKRLIALWNSTSHPYLEMKQVPTVSKLPVTLKQLTSLLYLKIMTMILVWMSSIQYPLCPASAQSTRDSELSEDTLSNPKWMDAMNVEMDALNKNKTWDLVPLPRGKKLLDADGKGLYQTYGVDYLETFAPVAKLNTVHYLASEFEMKSLGDLKYFLGIEVARSKHGIKEKTGMLDCKPIDTPSEQNHKLGLYPDQVPTIKSFMHSPSEDHMGAVMRILRYLKVTPGKGLMFCKYGHTDWKGIRCYWAGSVTDRRSTSGYFTLLVVILLLGGVKSKKWCLGLVPGRVPWDGSRYCVIRMKYTLKNILPILFDCDIEDNEVDAKDRVGQETGVFVCERATIGSENAVQQTEIV
ncbi:hypothetical protein Prudu_001908, partial [Prunus dulcis]